MVKKSFYLMCMATVLLAGCQTFQHAGEIERATDAPDGDEQKITITWNKHKRSFWSRVGGN